MTAKSNGHRIELLLKKAAVDPDFRTLLLERRAEAAKSIGLELSAEECALINSYPREQLATVIINTKVTPRESNALIGTAAAIALLAIGATFVIPALGRSRGIEPDRPPLPLKQGEKESDEGAVSGTTTTTQP